MRKVHILAHFALSRWLTKPILLLIFLFPSFPLKAQLLSGARAIALAEAVTALSNQPWAVFANPATLPDKGMHASFFGNRSFGMSELSDFAAIGTYANSFGAFGVGAHSYGFELFRESRFRLAYMKPYFGMNWGASVNYTHFYFPQPYNSGGGLSIDFGMLTSLTETLALGARFTNVSGTSVGSVNEQLPQEMALGLAYRMDKNVLFLGEVLKDVKFPISVRAGLEYKMIDLLYLRGGIKTQPNTYSIGVGFLKEKLSANIAVNRHELLGISPSIDFGYVW